MANRYWVGGSGSWSTGVTTNWSATSGGAGGASVPGTTDSVFFDQAGTYTVTMTGAVNCLDITVSAGTVTFAVGTSISIAGNMSLTTSTTSWSGSGLIIFTSFSVPRTITTSGTVFSVDINFNGTTGTWTLQDDLNLTSTKRVTLVAGTLDLNSKNVTCGYMSLTGTSTRTLAFGSTGVVTLTGTQTATPYVMNITDPTGLTCTGSKSVILLGSSLSDTNARSCYFNTNTADNTLNVTVKNGLFQFLLTGTGYFNDLTFDPTFTGTTNTTAIIVYGNFTAGSGHSYSFATTTFSPPTGTNKTLSSGGATLTSNVILSGAGTTTLTSAVTISSTSSFTLSSGTLNTAGYTLTAGSFSSNSGITRSLYLGSSTISLLNSGTIWDMTSIAGLTFDAGTSTITSDSTSSVAKTFIGGSLLYYKLNIGGPASVSTFTISGSNYFQELSCTKAGPLTLAFATSSTQSINTWSITNNTGISLSGTTVNLSIVNRPNITTAYVNVSGITATQAPLFVGVGSAVTTSTNVFASAYIAPFTHYWVGGTASWTTNANWSATSGGTAGAAKPYGDEDVVFNSASSAVSYSVDINNTGGLPCKNLTIGAPATGSLSINGSSVNGASAQINIFGSLSVAASGITTYLGGSYVQGLNFASNVSGNTLDFGCLDNGPMRAVLTFSGINGTWTLTSDCINQISNTSATCTHTAGTLNTNGYTFAPGIYFASTGNYLRTLNFGSSNVYVSVSSASGNFTLSGTNLTFNPGTSTVSSYAINGGGRAFYAISNNGGTLNSFGASDTTQYIIGQGPLSAGITTIKINNSGMSIVGLKTINTTGNRRVQFVSDTTAINRTLNITGTSDLTDADFRDIYVTGTTLTGTRLGDLGGCRGITFSTPKTVYWNISGNQTWGSTGWAATSGGIPNDIYYPLAQDTAVFNDTGGINGSKITSVASLPYIGTIDMSARTVPMVLAITSAITVYGDWKTGSGVTLQGGSIVTFGGLKTQTITSNGINFVNPITIDNYIGTVQLADAFTTSASTGLTVTSGTFDTKGYALTVPVLLSSISTNIKTINLNSSTVTLNSATPINFTTASTFYFNAGTSQINSTAVGGIIFYGANKTFYNVSLASSTPLIVDNNTFNTLTVTEPTSTGIGTISFGANQTINTFNCVGGSPIKRIGIYSDTLGTKRDLTVGTLNSVHCDFRDIRILGTASGTSTTGAGDCGGNAGIVFPAPKTVYWNKETSGNWSDTAWATVSGGSPDSANFPLAQDTAKLDNTNSFGLSVYIDNAWNIGTIDSSARTVYFSFNVNLAVIPSIYGSWLNGSGFTSNNNNTVNFSGRGTQTILSAGKKFANSININGINNTILLGDALILGDTSTTSNLVLATSTCTFDANSYNVTISGSVSVLVSGATIKMGSGTWTLSATGITVWSTSLATIISGTSNIVLSDTSGTARIFTAGTGQYYNKLTIGGTTGVSTTTVQSSGSFTIGELASTKTVAHTIAFGATTLTIGKWSVTGTAVGNAVTVTGTGAITIAGARVSGVDYLAMGTTPISPTSPGEFYAGRTSSGTGAGVVLTAAPAAVTRYWVGGTGTWDATTTTNWSATSGGTGGASVPTSADAVIFNSASSAAAYTVTCTATQLRCASLTMSGPASGNITWAGTAPLAIHDNVSLASTGITRTYTGAITLSGSTTGKIFTPNGIVFGSSTIVNGIGAEWSLGSAWSDGGTNQPFTITNGSFNTANYSMSAALASSNSNVRSISLGSSTITMLIFTTGFATSTNLTFNAGTSTISCTSAGTFNGGGLVYNNVSFATPSTLTLNGANTFNNFSITGRTTSGLNVITITANQIINGTLTLSAGTDATMRTFVQSDTIGTTRTLTCAAVSATDADFRDITIAGAAAPVSGIRLGDCKGNSGITFPAPKTVYWVGAGTGNWSANAWAATSGGAAALTNFPLAQDAAIFGSVFPNPAQTITINVAYNIGTIDMSARTTNTMTLATGTTTPTIYGNWINGTSTILSGTGTLTFAGRGSQTITSAGKPFSQAFAINSPNGSVTLQDAFIWSISFTLSNGIFDLGGYSASSSVGTFATGTGTKTLSFNGGTLSTGNGTTNAFNTTSFTGFTVTGTGTVNLTSAGAKTFAGGGISYSNITLNQGGAGALTITGNNTFKDITNTYGTTGASLLNLAATVQTVQQFTGKGTADKLLTISGTSAASPATLILTGSTDTTADYLNISNVRMFSTGTGTWQVGSNSINGGSFGAVFTAAVVTVFKALGNFFAFF